MHIYTHNFTSPREFRAERHAAAKAAAGSAADAKEAISILFVLSS